MLKKAAVPLFNSALALVVCTTGFAATARGDEPPPKVPEPSQSEKAYDDLAKQVADLEKFSRVFETVAKLVGPTVVHIQSKRATAFMRQRFTYEETGSGVIVRLPGYDTPYVLTNHHVVDALKPEQLDITTSDGRLLHAQKTWSDRESDVAVLAITEKDVPTARLGDSDKLQIGHWVLAIGSPFDLSGSISHGIISGKGRRSLRLGSGTGTNREVILNQDFIQTDAAINPGNSGGPLVNLRGEIVGLNTAIASQSGGSEGVGFSIPVNLVRRIATELIEKGSVTRAWLGIRLEPPLTAKMALKLGLPKLRGALVTDVSEDTPAAEAGLQRFDVILEINGKQVEDMEHVRHMISINPVGQDISLVVWRDRQEKRLTARLADRANPKFQPQQPDQVGRTLPRLEIRALEFTQADRARFSLPDQKGVLVLSVSPHSPAAQQIEGFDVIEQVDGKPVASLDETVEAISNAKSDQPLRMRVVRPSPQGPTRQEVVLKL